MQGFLVNCGEKVAQERMLALNGAQIGNNFIRVHPFEPKMNGTEIFDFVAKRLKVFEEVKGRSAEMREKTAHPRPRKSRTLPSSIGCWVEPCVG